MFNPCSNCGHQGCDRRRAAACHQQRRHAGDVGLDLGELLPDPRRCIGIGEEHCAQCDMARAARDVLVPDKDDYLILYCGGGYRAALAFFGDVGTAAAPTAVTCYNDLVAIGLYRALAG